MKFAPAIFLRSGIAGSQPTRSARKPRRLMKQPALPLPLSPREFLPGLSVGDDGNPLRFIKRPAEISTTIFHPVSTAKMGHCRPDPSKP